MYCLCCLENEHMITTATDHVNIVEGQTNVDQTHGYMVLGSFTYVHIFQLEFGNYPALPVNCDIFDSLHFLQPSIIIRSNYPIL